jgi:hypothetical protein
MAEHGSLRRLAPGVVSLQDITTSAPGLRFDVRYPAGPMSATRAAVGHGAGQPHSLAGTGKLFLAVAVARLAGRDPGLLPSPLTIRSRHRTAARTGTLRRMSGELQLTVDDAMALIVGTGDGACVVAVLELLESRGEDVLSGARQAVADLGLGATTLTGVETFAEDRGGGRAGQSWGEGLLGTTTPADLCTLLERLVTSGTPASERILGWMGKTFEPAGLASALPGFGPRTIPHRTVSGFELLNPPGAPGCASVLLLPADVGTAGPTACVAAYYPRTRADGSTTVSPVEVSAALGSLGLAVERSRAATPA